MSASVPILLFTHTQLVGGIANYVVRLAQGLRAHDHRVGVLCRDTDAIEGMRQQLRTAGVDVHNVHMDDHSPSGRITRVVNLARVVRQYRGGVLALMMGDFNTGAVITAAGVLGGAGCIVRGDLQPPMPPFSPSTSFKQRMRDWLVDRTVVGARENVTTLVTHIGLPASKIDVVHTGIDLERFDPTRCTIDVRPSLGLPPDATVVAALSRLEQDVWRKGIDHFLRMAARIGPTFPASRFLIVGDGASRPRLEAMARDLGIADRVVFAGWRTDVPDILSSIDVFVMPSLHEGGPTTVLEAMAMGRPVVATEVGMVPEVVEHGKTGLIVEPANVDALADAVAGLLSDPDLRAEMGGRAREVAGKSFGYDAMVSGYLDSFADALNSPRALWRKVRR